MSFEDKGNDVGGEGQSRHREGREDNGGVGEGKGGRGCVDEGNGEQGRQA